VVLTLGYQLEKETQHDIGTIAVHMVKHLNERQRSTSSFDGANGCNIVVSRQSVFIAYGGKVTPRASVARIFITQIYHTKPQSRKEEEKEIVFFPSFAPPRICVNHTVTAPEAVIPNVTLNLVQGPSISQKLRSAWPDGC
jgi:hypothetical protein